MDKILEIVETVMGNSENAALNRLSSVPKFTMETRKVRTPSARMLAAKQDEVYDKVSTAPPTTPKSSMSTISAQLAKVISSSEPITSSPPVLSQVEPLAESSPIRMDGLDKDPSPLEEEIDVSNPELEDSNVSKEDAHEDTMRMDIMKTEKMDTIVLNGDFQVSNEVVISSMKYNGRPPTQTNRKVVYMPMSEAAKSSKFQRGNFTGETLNLKSSDLSIPNKAAHFLYFRCYEEQEVQKEFPLTIDENRKGPQNFLVEPRVGLKNTDYYIDSYLWNRGKSTSSKKKIFVEIDGNHVKTSRRSIETAHYLLNWYYSNMENRICKKVCWLETVSDGVRASPVLVQYHVNYLSDNPIELRKTPKLYSDTRSVAQELLRSDSPLQTVARFVETGETDPREIINKKQAYEMRRYVMANARKRCTQRKRDFDEGGMFYDEEMYEEVYYDEHGEPVPANPSRMRELSEINRVASMSCRALSRKMENRITSILENRIGSMKMRGLRGSLDVQNHAELLSEWIATLAGTTADDYDIAIHNVTTSMRKQLEELLTHDGSEFLEEAGTSSASLKRRHHDDDDDVSASKAPRFEGERFIFDGQEYVEEEVIAEDMAEVPSTSANGGTSGAVKFDRAEGSTFFFQGESSNDVTVDQ